jgi:hypothetical protein
MVAQAVLYIPSSGECVSDKEYLERADWTFSRLYNRHNPRKVIQQKDSDHQNHEGCFTHQKHIWNIIIALRRL